MLRFMNKLTDKPDWFQKVSYFCHNEGYYSNVFQVNNEEIAEKWKNEVCGIPGLDFTPRMADWCINELRHVGSIYSESPGNTPPIFVYNGDVVKSDTAVSSELKQALQEEVTRFEAAIPETRKDWHPGSNGKVLDLVHPSLFPLVYGMTRILHEGHTTTLADCIERCGEGEIVPEPPYEETLETFRSHWSRMTEDAEVYSENFQWLPCEVNISGDHAK